MECEAQEYKIGEFASRAFYPTYLCQTESGLGVPNLIGMDSHCSELSESTPIQKGSNTKIVIVV